ncbi:MAG TPA: metallophosphoesterase [Chloroflexia bacterium]|nr:metallophosphoesterase [Chloroflexia bacterium]
MRLPPPPLVEATLPARRPGTRRILAVSDIVEPQLYNERVAEWMGPVDLILSCGDLPGAYLDFLMTVLSAPCYHVLGNHCAAPHGPRGQDHCLPEAYPGIVDLHGRTVAVDGLLLAGVEGSPWYNGGAHQYTEQQIAWTLRRLIPGLIGNYLRTGRYLDILVTHAPPRGIHDDSDITHRGFRSFLPFLRRFHPAYMLHGHTHRYINSLPFRTSYARTTVVNAYGHRILEVPRDARQLRSREDHGP